MDFKEICRTAFGFNSDKQPKKRRSIASESCRRSWSSSHVQASGYRNTRRNSSDIVITMNFTNKNEYFWIYPIFYILFQIMISERFVDIVDFLIEFNKKLSYGLTAPLTEWDCKFLH